ncbi:hypothetical protein AYM02_10245 [Coxiella burnetii]|uniref:hypothetical protein n=1 Tax=Coxiella burnetii TaxID=777 RepID=UPI000474721A|nr:hypothetical protein [Coxiella burnetii]AML49650.1 hypothetical protein AUR58_11125 [Coxiella burnetii]AML55555.1 hypothetical protein AYM38_10105 [Coxiella burnetii]ATN69534.1 hypothetical protein AYM00_10610 [Coxiella burnetii]ATN71455.1 hypothetical protein AYM02_10245 [Coxiella burnetii]ATN73349.1 hypothetical protein AYM11_09930 [Coxiella burnetii]
MEGTMRRLLIGFTAFSCLLGVGVTNAATGLRQSSNDCARAAKYADNDLTGRYRLNCLYPVIKKGGRLAIRCQEEYDWLTGYISCTDVLSCRKQKNYISWAAGKGPFCSYF